MKLLIATQAMDERNPALGFFVSWVRALAPRYERIEVICLEEGMHTLPDNVTVHSLGKERGRSIPLLYAIRFKWLAWRLRHRYDAVFVHMNQEYLLIAGPLWKVFKKPVYFWRNHYAGSWLTGLAAAFATRVFYTSMHSYTARFRNAMRMPVGVDLAAFEERGTETREPRSILFLARIAPSKRPDLFIDALGLLIARGVSFIASVYGSPLPDDERYYESLKMRVEELGLHGRVRFHPAVAHRDTAPVYRAHDIFVNCSRSGMFDKTLFEASACGCLVLAMSEDFAELTEEESKFTDAESLANALETSLSLSPEAHAHRQLHLHALAKAQALESLVEALSIEIH